MKLNRETKKDLEIGDVLRDSCGDYTVLNIIHGMRGNVSLTLRIPDGRTLYAYPSSQCYGMEIIKNAEK